MQSCPIWSAECRCIILDVAIGQWSGSMQAVDSWYNGFFTTSSKWLGRRHHRGSQSQSQYVQNYSSQWHPHMRTLIEYIFLGFLYWRKFATFCTFKHGQYDTHYGHILIQVQVFLNVETASLSFLILVHRL